MTQPLPSYQEKSAAVKERFAELYQRPLELELNGLSKTFTKPDGSPVQALLDIDLKIHRRELIAVLGASGCGKSTLIRIIAGLETPTTGEALLQGESIDGPCSQRGMVFQSYTLFPWLTVLRNVMFGLEATGHSPVTAESEARQWIELVGLKKFENAYPDQLSGGMKQRVAIARALANEPRVLLMDEPFGALDAHTRADMQSYLLQIWRNVDVTILFVTHDLDEAIYLADRILVLSPNPGQVQEFIENPVPRPRSPEQFSSPEFLATKEHVENLIHPPEARSEPVNLPILKLTQQDDRVE